MNQQSNVTILLVDDDEGHVELMRRNLRRAGLVNRIESVNNGREALDFVFHRGAHAQRPQNEDLLVLLDINMPGGLDGIEVLRQIKQSEQASRVPVIMLTTTDDPREVARCYELGCSVYVTKPVAPEAFTNAIQRLGLFMSIVRLPPAAYVRKTMD